MKFKSCFEKKLLTILRYILFILLSYNCLAQSYRPLIYEKVWAISHPVAALRLKKVYQNCFVIYRQNNIKGQLDTFENGGKIDAFRHVFFMAAFSQKVKVKKIRKLGVAHERGNYLQFKRGQFEEGELPDSLSSVMDLQNNELGFEIGLSNKKIGLENLKEIVINRIIKGEAMIIKRNKQGYYLDCNNKIIELPGEKKWQLKKCLVSSNFNYGD